LQSLDLHRDEYWTSETIEQVCSYHPLHHPHSHGRNHRIFFFFSDHFPVDYYDPVQDLNNNYLNCVKASVKWLKADSPTAFRNNVEENVEFDRTARG
jgi:hypothetical protein